MKRVFSVGTGIIILLLFQAGTYRHDVAIEKYLDLAKGKAFENTGRVFFAEAGNWTAAGSCILIDSLHILTAGHCVAGEIKRDTIVNYQGHKVKTYVVAGRYVRKPSDVSFWVKNQTVHAKRIVIHTNFLNKGDKSYDLAVVELEKPITCQSIRLNQMLDEVGDTVTGIGYGASGPGNYKSILGNYNIKLAGHNIIDSMGGSKFNGNSTKLYADFDSPYTTCNCNRTGSANPLTLEYLPMGGDSGSPLFRIKNGAYELVGVVQGNEEGAIPKNLKKIGYYGQVASWIRVSVFHNWIKQNL